MAISRNQFSLIFLLLNLVIVLGIEPEISESLDDQFLWFLCIDLLLLLINHCFYCRHDKNWLRLDVLFLVGFVIVHFQSVMMYSLGGTIFENVTTFWFNQQYVNYAVWLSLIGLNTWLIGFRVVFNSREQIVRSRRKYLVKKSALVIAVSVFFLIFLLSVGSEFIGGHYIGTRNWEGYSAYFYLVFFQLLSVAIVLIFGEIIFAFNRETQSNLMSRIGRGDTLLLSVIFLSYLLLFLFIGNRSGPLQLIIVFFLLVAHYIKPVRWYVLIVIFFSGGALFTFIGMARGEGGVIDGLETIDIDKLEDVLEFGYYGLSIELARSFNVLPRSLEYVNLNGLFYGELMVNNIASVVPFGQRMLNIVYDNTNGYSGSADLISAVAYGDSDYKSGLGTSVIADVYLNFGKYGVGFFLFVLGFVIRKMNLILKAGNNLKMIVFVMLVGSELFYLSRGAFFILVQPLFYCYIFFNLFVSQKKMIKESV